MAARKAKPSTPQVFSPYEFPCGLKAKNRLVKAPMYEHLSNFLGGPPNSYHVGLYSAWSRYNWGMVITGNVQISGSHLTLGRDLVVPEHLTEETEKPYKALARAVKGNRDDVLAVMQLSHAGRQSANFVGGRYVFEAPLAPSAVPVRSSVVTTGGDVVAEMAERVLFQVPREMEVGDVEDVKEGFVRGALLAYRSGFDGVELHVAHGYLLAQFLSPKSNKRKDKYSLRSENGLRLLHEIVDGIRAATPESRFIVGVKLNASDYLLDAPGNASGRNQPLDTEETRALQHVLALAAWGTIDFIDISGGDYENPEFISASETRSRRQAFFARFSQQALKSLDSAGFKYPSRPAIMLTGGLRTPNLVHSALQAGQADMLGIGRCSVVCPKIPEVMREYYERDGSVDGDAPFGPEPQDSTPGFLTRWPVASFWKSLSKVKLVGAGLNTAWYTIVIRQVAIAEVEVPDYSMGTFWALIRIPATMQDYLEGKIDFIGQQTVDEVSRYVLVGATGVSFVVGFAMQSLSVTFGIFGAATALLLLAIIPPWPMLRQHPVMWLRK